MKQIGNRLNVTGDQIKSARRMAGFTKSQLAERLKISTPRMTLIEQGRVDLTSDEIEKLLLSLRSLQEDRQEL